MQHIKKVIKLSQATCLSIRDIEKITRLPRSTVNDYLNRFKQSGLNYEDLKQLSDSQIYGKLFKEPVQKRGKVKPDFCYIHNELKKTHVTRQLLWEEYKQQHPDGFGYTQFCYHLAEWSKKLSLSMRQIHRAGEKLFIDYSGLKGQITDPTTGVIEEVDIFVCTLGASSFTYAEASANQKLASFITSHINAFEYFEGTAKVLVPVKPG